MAATQEKKQPDQQPGLGVHFLRDGAARAQALNQQPDSIPAMMKPGEFVLPPDTVHAVGGVHFLKKMVDATHTPAPSGAGVPRGVPPEFRPEMFFANGGLVDDEAKRPNSFGDAAAATSNSGVTQVGAPPAPSAPAPVAPRAAPQTATSVQKAYDDWQATKPSWFAQQTPTGRMREQQAEAAYGKALQDSYGQVKFGGNPGAAPEARQPLPSGVAPSTAGAGRGSVSPPLADPSKPPPSMPQLQGWDRGNMTNAQVAQANPQGVVTARRGANGTMEFSGNNVSGPVSYADAGGKPMEGKGIEGRGWGGFGVAPAGVNVVTGPNGSYAYSTTPGDGGPRGVDPLRAHPAPAEAALGVRSFAPDAAIFAGQRSPVGMSVEQAHQGATGGSNDAPGLGVRPALTPANAAPAPGLGVWPALRGAQSTNDPNASGSYEWMKDLRDPRTLAMRNAAVGSTIFRNQAEAMMAGKARQANIAGARGAVAGQMHDAQQADTARYQADNTLAGNLGTEQMRQQGANQRSLWQYALDQQRVNQERETQGVQNRGRTIVQALQEQISNEQDAAKRGGIAQRLREIQGGQTADPYLVVPGGQHVDPQSGKAYNTPASVFNRQSGQFVQQPGQGGGLSQGMTKIVGTSGGKPVYEDANGKRYVAG